MLKFSYPMKRYKEVYYSLIIILLLGSGCGYFVRNETAPIPDSARYELKGQVIDPAFVRKSGTLLILPFKPGKNVPANEALDRLALTLIRGIVDVFKENPDKTELEIIFNEEGGTADFILDGYITKMKKPSQLSRWLFHDSDFTVTVQGEITRRNSIHPVMTFSDTVKMPQKQISRLGLVIGTNIGHFIIDSSDKKKETLSQ